ncbi:peptide-methionine (R)-S-oxide reductase MsrB [Alphaproteobacteria bacterium]|nr:peptide-methionine (R)-S-oxide reductase MsrB [Alphaproteobacteria bacterium]
MDYSNLNRREFIAKIVILMSASFYSGKVFAMTDKDWKEKLRPEEYDVLRKEGTERPNSSALNNEKRDGDYLCVGCDSKLFTSEMKFDSGTGWPSFFDYVPESLGFKTDFKIVIPRKEYHCSKCGGHHGHVFKDGPQPTGLRYCNNGIVLKFVPKD